MSVDRYAVVGNPIAHSKSPDIHALFAQQTGQNIIYEKVSVEPEAFAAHVRTFFQSGGKGLNITVPFKENAFRLADHLSERARLAEAVNTLSYRTDGSILGDNTDGAGLLRDMLGAGWTVRDKRVLILGAGGAVRGVLQPLMAEQPTEVTIANRTVEKAQALRGLFSDYGCIYASGFGQLAGKSFDLIINGTSASLTGTMPSLPHGLFTSDACAYDMVYSAKPTVFLQWARETGAAKLRDGLGMLVGQAAESFYLWRGVKPDIQPVVTRMRSLMQT